MQYVGTLPNLYTFPFMWYDTRKFRFQLISLWLIVFTEAVIIQSGCFLVCFFIQGSYQYDLLSSLEIEIWYDWVLYGLYCTNKGESVTKKIPTLLEGLIRLNVLVHDSNYFQPFIP